MFEIYLTYKYKPVALLYKGMQAALMGLLYKK